MPDIDYISEEDIQSVEDAVVGISGGKGELSADLGALNLMMTNATIRDLLMPVIDDITTRIAEEIANIEAFIASSPLGQLEQAMEDAGVTADIEFELEGL